LDFCWFQPGNWESCDNLQVKVVSLTIDGTIPVINSRTDHHLDPASEGMNLESWCFPVLGTAMGSPIPSGGFKIVF
jgi:hypothetical protein